MESFVLTENRFVPLSCLDPNNRGFLYGDGFFETILVQSGAPLFWVTHKQRMILTADYLKLQHDEWHSLDIAVSSWLDEFADDHPFLRWRITVFRDGLGKYAPEKNETKIVLNCEPLSHNPFCTSTSKTWEISHQVHEAQLADRFKLIGKHKQVLYAKEALDRKLDDLLVFNSQDQLVEAVSGNVFVLMGNKWVTPPLSSGALDGVIRKVLLEEEKAEEQHISRVELLNARKLFTTNAIEGIRGMNDITTGREIEMDELALWLQGKAASSILDFQENQP
ncbi:MAG: aminotransferase class IV [Salibacteraceae bacterium]